MDDYPGADFIQVVKHDTYPAVDPTKADLSGKVVVLTGASRGIGLATALAVAQSGARGLVLLARSNLHAVKEQCLAVQRPGKPLEVLAIHTDVANNDSVVAAAKQVENVFGAVNALVNNAGYVERFNLVADSDAADWQRTIDVNVSGTYLVTRAFLPLLVKSNGYKAIVNVASSMSHALIPMCSGYATAKFALLRFTEYTDLEYRDKGVLTHAVHPGAIVTEMSSTIPDEYQHLLVDTPEIAAHTILWLVKEPRDWLAGRFVDCRWDVEALLSKKQEIVDGDKLKVKLAV